MSPNPTTFVTPSCALPSPVALSQTLKSLVIALATHTQALTGPTTNVEQHLTQVHNQAAVRTYNKTVTNTFSSPRLSTSSTTNTRSVLYVGGRKSSPVQSEQHYQGGVGLKQNTEGLNHWITGRRKGKGSELKKETVNKLSFDDLRRRHVIEEGWEILKEQFVDDASIDWGAIHRRLQRRVKKMRTDEDMEQILYWLYTRAGDPFTRYLSLRQLEAMKGDIDGQMCGVGIVFNAERHGWLLRDKRVVIKHVVPGSPADEAGLVCGDQITAIDMTNISELSFDEATTRLLGKVGRKVLLTFRRENDMELSVLLHRRQFQVPTVSAELVGDDVCYVQIREFAMNTTKQMHECLYRIMKTRQKKQLTMTMMNGMSVQPDVHEMNDRLKLLILDLRGNSGGLVDKAVEVARMFLQPEETVVKFVGRSGTITVETGRETRWLLFWSLWRQLSSVMPVFLGTWRATHGGMSTMYETMVILVDSETASASELLACALRDNCKALIIGTTTFGKGSVQAIVPFSNGGGAAVTVARYLTPKDHAIGLGNGIRPDWVAFKIPSEPPLIVERLFGRPRIGRILGLNKKMPIAPPQELNKKQIKWIKSKLESCLARKQSCTQDMPQTNQMR